LGLAEILKKISNPKDYHAFFFLKISQIFGEKLNKTGKKRVENNFIFSR